MRLKKYRIIKKKTKKKTQTKTKGGIHANGIIFGNILEKLKNAVEYLVLLFGKIKKGLLFSIQILDPVEWITFFANYSKDMMNNPTTKLQFDAFFAELSTLYAKIQIKKYLEIIGNEFYNKFSLLLQFFGELKSIINASDYFNKVYETIKFYVEKIKMILGLNVDDTNETIVNYYQEVPKLKNLNIEKETFTEVLQELLNKKQFQSMTEDEINNNEEWKTYEGSLSQSEEIIKTKC
jgi:predicted CopG family antitoxin